MKLHDTVAIRSGSSGCQEDYAILETSDWNERRAKTKNYYIRDKLLGVSLNVIPIK
jgi:hypothetical protein